MTEHDPQQSPDQHDDAGQLGLPNTSLAQGGEGSQDYNQLASLDGQPRGVKRQRPAAAEDDDDDEDGKGGRERRKIEIKFIQDKSRRHITFSKRKAGIMKKAYELSVLTGTQVLLLVVSETGLVYTFTTPKLQPLVTKPEGKNLIQTCLNAPETGNPENGVDDGSQVDSPEDSGHASLPPQPGMQNPNMPLHPGNAPYMTPEQAAQNAAYQNYVRGNSGHMAPGQYPMPPNPALAQHHPSAQIKH